MPPTWSAKVCADLRGPPCPSVAIVLGHPGLDCRSSLFHPVPQSRSDLQSIVPNSDGRMAPIRFRVDENPNDVFFVELFGAF